MLHVVAVIAISNNHCILPTGQASPDPMPGKHRLCQRVTRAPINTVWNWDPVVAGKNILRLWLSLWWHEYMKFAQHLICMCSKNKLILVLDGVAKV